MADGPPGGGGAARFVAGRPQHNPRLALALVPAVALLCGAGGAATAGALVVGLMAAYILDLVRSREGALIAVWLTLAATYLALLLAGNVVVPGRSVVLSIGVLFTCGQCLFLVGCWASIQFKWLALEAPVAVLAMEKLLFAACPVICAAIDGWGLTAAVGPTASAFFLSAIMLAFYAAFGLPTRSSFATRGADVLVLSPQQAGGLAMAATTIPPLVYAAAHIAVLDRWEHLWSILLLFATPPLLLCLASPVGALWWVPAHLLEDVKASAAPVALICFILGLEGRVVFHAFGDFIRLPPPLSYVVVTVAMFGGAGVITAAALGAIGDRKLVPYTHAGFVFVGSAALGAFAVGVPLWLQPIVLLATAGLTQFYTSVAASDYLLFVGGSLVCASWFIGHNFWFLEVELGGLTLQHICTNLVICANLAAAAPGLSFAGAPPTLTALLLVVQAHTMASVEAALYTESKDDEGAGMYPAYLLVLTSAAGVSVVGWLKEAGRIPPNATWLLMCLYTAKLLLLVLPEPETLPAGVLVSLAASAPSAMAPKRGRMHPVQGIFHLLALSAALLYARFTVYDLLFITTGHRPSDATLFGGLLLILGISALPTVSQHFEHMQNAQRLITGLVGTGVMLLVLKPPLPWKGEVGFWYDAEHVPDNEPDDVAIYGARGVQSSHHGWPAWLLTASVLTALTLGMGRTPIMSRSPALRLTTLFSLGLTTGLYVAVEYFPSDSALGTLLAVTGGSLAVFVAFTLKPSATSPVWLPYLFAAMVAALPLGLLLAEETSIHAPGERISLLEARARREELKNSMLGVFTAVFVLVAFVVKIRVGAVLSAAVPGAGAASSKGGSQRRGGPNPFQPFAGRRTAHLGTMRGALSVKHMTSAGAGWMPAVGNTAIVLAFVIALILNASITGGSDLAIFPIAPLLILLNQDALLLSGLSDRRRYAPLTAALIAYLVTSTLLQLVSGRFAAVASADGPRWVLQAKNLVGLLCTLPNGVLFVQFLWSHARQPELVLLAVTPLNVPPLVLADISTLRVLSIVGIAGAAIQFMVSRHQKHAGSQYL